MIHHKILRTYNLLSRPLALGFFLRWLLHPVAVLTGRTDCTACAARAERLNGLVPNITPLLWAVAVALMAAIL